MRRFAEALGLLGHETADGAWFIPLTRAAAAAARGHIEGLLAKRVPLFDGVAGPLAQVQALELSWPSGTLRYVLGGRFAALQRVLIVTGDPVEVLLQAGLADLAAAPSPELIEQHGSAMALARLDPVPSAMVWLDGPRWPPPTEPGSAFERTGSAERFAVTGAIDPVLRARCDGLYSVQRGADAVASILRRGMVCRRWLILEKGVADGTSPVTDLVAGGAAFVFARLLLPERRPLPIESGYDYAVIFGHDALLSLDRFALGHDRYGGVHALLDALPDAELCDRLVAGTLALDHEILFADTIGPQHVSQIVCRSDEARDRLLDLAPQAPVIVADTLIDAACNLGCGGSPGAALDQGP